MEGAAPRWCGPAVVMAALVGLGLMADSLRQSSATYDEVAYLRVAARWWRTGDQDEITRMGSPLTFWKLQQVPVLWALDRVGSREMVEHPIEHQQALLPMVRLWSLVIWLIALGLAAWWSRLLYGPRAMAFAAWVFTLSPNLLAHGSLATMEFPLLACTTGMFLLFWVFLQTGDRRPFWGAAVLGGLAWSCTRRSSSCRSWPSSGGSIVAWEDRGHLARTRDRGEDGRFPGRHGPATWSSPGSRCSRSARRSAPIRRSTAASGGIDPYLQWAIETPILGIKGFDPDPPPAIS
ncbi:MAG: hypothetical protein WKF75_03700 [Singulisphaera sp.]